MLPTHQRASSSPSSVEMQSLVHGQLILTPWSQRKSQLPTHVRGGYEFTTTNILESASVYQNDEGKLFRVEPYDEGNFRGGPLDGPGCARTLLSCTFFTLMGIVILILLGAAVVYFWLGPHAMHVLAQKMRGEVQLGINMGIKTAQMQQVGIGALMTTFCVNLAQAMNTSINCNFTDVGEAYPIVFSNLTHYIQREQVKEALGSTWSTEEPSFKQQLLDLQQVDPSYYDASSVSKSSSSAPSPPTLDPNKYFKTYTESDQAPHISVHTERHH